MKIANLLPLERANNSGVVQCAQASAGACLLFFLFFEHLVDLVEHAQRNPASWRQPDHPSHNAVHQRPGALLLHDFLKAVNARGVVEE